MSDKYLGDVLRERRNALGLNLKTLAEKAGLSQPTVAHYEKGRAVPKLTCLVAICQVLELDIKITDIYNDPTLVLTTRDLSGGCWKFDIMNPAQPYIMTGAWRLD